MPEDESASVSEDEGLSENDLKPADLPDEQETLASSDEEGKLDLRETAAAAAAAALAGAVVQDVLDDEPENDREVAGESPVDDVAFTPQGEKDDLTLIQGIDEDLELVLNELGVQNFSQIAELTEQEMSFLRERLDFTSDINEQGWIEQAKILAAGGLTHYAQDQKAADPTEDQLVEAEPLKDHDERELVKASEAIEQEEDNNSKLDGGVLAAAAAAVLSRAGTSDADEEPEVSAADIVSDERDESKASERSERDEGDGRLFGRDARERRDEEWRQRYDRERRILPPGERGELESGDAAGAVTAASVIAADEAPVSPPADSDDLKQIKYISTGLEKKLNLLGVYKLSQIAAWSGDDVASISEQLELKGRIEEEDWMGQAQEVLNNAQEEAAEEGAPSGSLVSGLVARLAELDQIEDLSEHEKTLLSNAGITSLSQVANWSGADMKWAADVLGLDDLVRISGWVTVAKGLISNNGDGVAPSANDGGDDLKRIRGIDEETEAALKDMGITSYAEIAAFEQEDMNRVNEALGTAGRVERQYWVVQAKVLRDGGDTDFSKLYDGSRDA